MAHEKELPDGWKVKKLGEVAEYINGRPFKPKEWSTKGLPIIRIQNLTKTTNKINYYSGDYEEKHLVIDGDILLAWSATLDIFEWNEGRALLNQHIFNVKINDEFIVKKYFFYYIKNIMDTIKGRTHGTGMTHITKPMLLSMDILVPPLNTQEKIVSKLDSFFSHYNKLLEERRKVREMRETILQSIIYGFLSKNKWPKQRLGDICEINPKKGDIKDFADDLEISFIPMSEVDEIRGVIRNHQIRKLKEVKKGYTYFKENDVLLAKITPCMENGKAAIARNLKNGIGFGSTEFYVIRPNENILSDYIFSIIRQPLFRKMAASKMSGTAGQMRVPSSFLEDFEISVLPVSEQRSLISIIDRIKPSIEKVAEEDSMISIACEQLPKAVLSKAFGGEL